MLLAGVTYGSTQALADDSGEGFPPLIQRLIERFNLDEEEVGEVLSDFREEHHVMMQTRMDERLSQLVSEGTITTDQKQALLDKHVEMRAEHEELMANWDSLTEEERLATHDAHRDELQAWAEENGLDLSEVLGIGKFHGGIKHHGMGFWK